MLVWIKYLYPPRKESQLYEWLSKLDVNCVDDQKLIIKELILPRYMQLDIDKKREMEEVLLFKDDYSQEEVLALIRGYSDVKLRYTIPYCDFFTNYELFVDNLKVTLQVIKY